LEDGKASLAAKDATIHCARIWNQADDSCPGRACFAASIRTDNPFKVTDRKGEPDDSLMHQDTLKNSIDSPSF